MKQSAVLASSLFLALAATLIAQEKAVNGGRRTLTFQPGAKQPDELARDARLLTAQISKPPEKVVEKPAAPVPAVPKGPAEIAQAFFSQLGKGEIDAAYASLTKGSKIAERPEELRALKTKTNEAIEVFGLVRGYDLVESKPIGDRLVRATYISLGKEFPLRWRFYFYKGEDVWKLIDLRVDDKLAGIFDEPEEAKPADKP